MKQKTKIKTSMPYDCKGAIVIRWGWYGDIVTDRSSIVYNKAEAIKLANDKGLCRKRTTKFKHRRSCYLSIRRLTKACEYSLSSNCKTILIMVEVRIYGSVTIRMN